MILATWVAKMFTSPAGVAENCFDGTSIVVDLLLELSFIRRHPMPMSVELYIDHGLVQRFHLFRVHDLQKASIQEAGKVDIQPRS